MSAAADVDFGEAIDTPAAPWAPGLSAVERAHRDAAEAFTIFCDGLEDGGHPELARRGRLVARGTLELADALTAERSARRAIQRGRDTAVAILERQAGAALQAETT